MSLNASANSMPARLAVGPHLGRRRGRGRPGAARRRSSSVDVHGRDELAAVLEQGGELGVREAGDVLDVVGLVGLEQQQRRRAGGGRRRARGRSAGRGRRRRRRRRASRRGGGRGAAGSASTGRGRARRRAAARGSSRRPRSRSAQAGLELAVDAAEEHDLAGGAEGLGRGPLLGLAGCDQRGGVLVGVPGALRAVGEDQVVHDAAGGGPLGQRGAAPELDVVGVGADGQRHARASGRSTDTASPAAGQARRASRAAARSAGTSTSQPSRGSRTTRSGQARGARPRPVAGERARPVGEAEARRRSGRDATLVPSSWRSGTRVTPSTSADPRRGRGRGAGRRGPRSPGRRPSAASCSTPSVDRAVEAAARAPEHRGAGRARPTPPRRRRRTPRPPAAAPAAAHHGGGHRRGPARPGPAASSAGGQAQLGRAGTP